MLPEQLKQSRQKLAGLLDQVDFSQTREGVSRESRARIVCLGLPGAGKSTLLNQIFGWVVSSPRPPGTLAGPIEDFGLFCLVDLPKDLGAYSFLSSYEGNTAAGANNGYPEVEPELSQNLPLGALDPLEIAAGADLLLYVLDGVAGAQAADYRWVGRLRRLGIPLLLVMNKCDRLTETLAERQEEIESRLAAPLLPVSALAGTHVADRLLPRIIKICPRLAVALGRELHSFRRQVARGLIQKAAWLNGLIALEPVPLLDLPLQLIILSGLMFRLAALYHQPASELGRREVIAAMAGGLASRYGAQQLAKLIPVAGWLVSSAIGWSATWVMGQAAIAYFEAGGDAVVEQRWEQTKGGLSQAGQAIYRRWRKRPRVRLTWPQDEETPLTSAVEQGE